MTFSYKRCARVLTLVAVSLLGLALLVRALVAFIEALAVLLLAVVVASLALPRGISWYSVSYTHLDNTPNPLLVGGDVAAPLFTDIAQALASDAGPLDDLVPVQQEGLNITRETVCTATGDLDVSLCGDTRCV